MVDRSDSRGSERHSVLPVNDDGPDVADQRRSLERRGFHVISTSDMDAGLTIARQKQPLAIFLKDFA